MAGVHRGRRESRGVITGRRLRRALARQSGQPFVPVEPQGHMKRLIALLRGRADALAVLHAAKEGKETVEALEGLEAATRRLNAYRSRGHGRSVFSPAHNRQAGLSKYTPHQGKQECLRRRLGGWATTRGLLTFYDPGAPRTKQQYLEAYPT